MYPPPVPPTARLPLAPLACLAAAVGCGPTPFEVDLLLLFAEAQAPLSGASSIRVDAVFQEGEPVSATFSPTSGEHRIEGMREGAGVVFFVHVTDSAGAVLALGRSLPIDVGPLGAAAAVFVGEADSLARIPDGLAVPRTFASVIAAPGGRVVVVGGGHEGAEAVAAVEIVGRSGDDPLHGTVAGELPRIGHVLTWVPEEGLGPRAGLVVVIGGTTSASGDTLEGGGAGAVATISTVDPLSGEVRADVAQMPGGWMGMRAASTREGLLALVGGLDADGAYVTGIRLYDPATDAWSDGPEAIEQEQHALAAFDVQGDAFLLTSGGVASSGVAGDLRLWTGVSDDPTSDLGGLQMTTPRARHQSTALGDGRVLITGGATDLADPSDRGHSVDTAEIVDPVFRTCSPLAEPMLVARQRHVAVAIAGGRVLVCAGEDSAGTSLGSCEAWDPESEAFGPFLGGSMSPGGPGIAAAPLGDGRILFSGGASSLGPDRSVYIYTPPEFE